MERPIILKAHEVRGILDGRQTQLRRIIRPQPWLQQAATKPEHRDIWCVWKHPRLQKGAGTCGQIPAIQNHLIERCPYGQVGDRLWGREGFGLMSYDQGDDCKTDIIYREDPWFLESDGKTRTEEKIGNWDLDSGRWRPAQHMPRWASRILLEIVSVRAEPLQDITEADALAEGFPPLDFVCCNSRKPAHWTSKEVFVHDWIERHGYDAFLHGANSYEANPWVWVVEFKRVAGDE